MLRGGEPIPLMSKVFDTLQVLVENSGRVMEKDELLQALWPDTIVEEHNLTQNVSALRKALGETPNEGRYIVTIPGRGYRFIAGVREVRDEGTDLVVLEHSRSRVVMEEREENGEAVESENGKTENEISRPATAPQDVVLERRGHPRLVLLGVLALGVMVLAGIGLFRPLGPGEAIDSLAILPLVEEGADPDMEYLSVGITESLIDRVSQLPKLKVIALSSVVKYKGQEIDAKKVGQELGVRAILMGRVFQRGDRLSISLALVDARDNRHLWGQRYDRKLSGLLASQGEISGEIAEKLRLRLSGDERKRLAKVYTENVEAYHLYLRGRFFRNKGVLEKAIDYYNQAISLEPNYAPAYAGLADCYIQLTTLPINAESAGEASLKARDVVMKALEIDETLAETHLAMSRMKSRFDWDWLGAEREIKRALELNPNLSDAHQRYAWYLKGKGLPDEAIAQHKRALDLDPMSPEANESFGQLLCALGQYDEAMAQMRKTLELDPSLQSTHHAMGNCYARQGRHEEALAEFNRPGPRGGKAKLHLGYVYAVSGRTAEARKILDEFMELSKKQPLQSIRVAVIYAGLGERDKAFEWIEKAYLERPRNQLWETVNEHYFFDNLRSDPRFTDLLRRMGRLERQ
ncbi:MAG: tetratricopeptide repeat protein [Acidobacteria bacterium]|nr:tetratricopeptide repeat protein [Acidobacteriota bacterium]